MSCRAWCRISIRTENGHVTVGIVMLLWEWSCYCGNVEQGDVWHRVMFSDIT
jgi:hypothetical protein